MAFCIDQSKCIGCHACSVACKSENQVPLGVYRTWVKYVEVGNYPNVRRHFQVTRCNHCANPPCVRICPVGAMYQRHDGIVEFDSSVCIGCKSCIQACPYDSIYLDPDTHTAAKCHFCAHRIEMGLEPACVVVCPEHAIIAGDLDDPNSEISRKLSRAQATVRKPEQGTGPSCSTLTAAIGRFIRRLLQRMLRTCGQIGSQSKMWPLMLAQGRMMGEIPPGRSLAPPVVWRFAFPNLRAPRSVGPIQIGGRMAEHMVQTAYNAQHKIYWHWELPVYLVTKNIAGGLFMLLSLGAALGIFAFESVVFLAAGFTALFFTLITALLLIKDLSQPKRFFTILLRPQWKSWVARGAFILVGFSIVASCWWLLEGLAQMGILSASLVTGARPIAGCITFPLAFLAVIYTAFLLGQAEGRDMWQSQLLPFQLFTQSVMVASGVFLLLKLVVPFPESLSNFLLRIFPGFLVLNLLMTLAGKLNSFASEVALLGYREMTKGRFRHHYWWGGIVLGHLLPLTFVFFVPSLMPLAALCAVIGLFFYEYAFVLAPQYIPNS